MRIFIKNKCRSGEPRMITHKGWFWKLTHMYGIVGKKWAIYIVKASEGGQHSYELQDVAYGVKKEQKS